MTPLTRKLWRKACNAAQSLGAAIGVLLLISVPLLSQGNAGRILGAITDQTGGAISGATITVLDTQRGTSRTLTTDDAGAYNAPNLLPGTYSVRAEFKGFRTLDRQNIVLEVGQDLRVDLTLQPGEQAQTVTVTESLPLVETTNAELGGTLQSAIIDNLPLNGRNFENLLQLRPGVTIYPGGSGWAQSTNGMRAHDNLYLVNGVNSSDPWMGQSVMNAVMAGGDAGTILPVDAIDEFKTQENPRAEYGWKPGGIVNIGVKAGTNAIHGTGYAYGRDTALDARNYFNPPVLATANGLVPYEKQQVALEQFGGTFGGPIKKDKLFYFVNYEGQLYSIGNPSVHKVPITAAGGGAKNSLIDACLAAAKSAAPSPTLTALSAELAGLSYNAATLGTATPTANCTPVSGQPAGGFQGLFPVNPGPTTAFPTDVPSTNTVHGGLGKVDYHINEHHSLAGMYFISQGNAVAVDAPVRQIVTPFLSNEYARSQVASGSWTWTPNSQWVNEARVGFSHYFQNFESVDHTIDPAHYTFNGATYAMPTGVTNPFYFGMPAITIQGGFNNGIGAGWPKVVGPDGVLSIVDNVSYLRGAHAFKFGGEILANQSTEDVTANAKGPLRFPNMTSFFTGTPNLATLFTGNPVRHFTSQAYGIFLQDDWRLKPRFVLNLGLRYELTTVMKDRDNGLANFDPNRGIVQVGNGIDGPYHGDHNNISPRLGFAWDVRGNGKTVVRAGASIIYESQISLDVTNGIGNFLGLRSIPTGLPIFNNGSTTALPVAGNITAASNAYTGAALSPITAAWQAFNPSQPIGVGNAPLYSGVAAPACGDGKTKPTGFVKAPGTCNIVGIDQNLRTPYVENWNVGIQRAITNNLSLDVGYVGNHGVKLLGKVDMDQPPPGAGWGMPANAAVLFGVAETQLAACIAKPTGKDSAGNALCAPNSNLEQAARPFTAPCAASIPALGAPNGSGGPFNPGNHCFSYLNFIAIINNSYVSSYNALQATLTGRNYHGMSFTAGYTYAHALGDASDQGTSGNFPIPLNNYGNVHDLLYAPSDFDIRHRFTLSVNYAIPGKKGFGQLLEGWAINSIVLLNSGAPWGLADTTTDFSGTSEAIGNGASSQGEQWNFFGNPKDFTPIHGFTDNNGGWQAGGGGLPYFSGTSNANCVTKATAIGPAAVASLTNLGCFALGSSVLIPAAYGSYGNTRRNLWRDAGFRNWDLSVTKSFKFKERLTTQFKAEFFNVLNHPIFSNPTGGPGGGVGDPSGSPIPFGFTAATPDTYSSNPQLGSGGSRAIQLGMKVSF